ncbi:heat shock factor binding protein 1-domain-containing protein [Rhizophagus diaphanus]|nr:heat shock factor binding protein 1-domain-containing protein [Rhizophagus diaphanus] [Rhizophagus sp. MUCL 43196]
MSDIPPPPPPPPPPPQQSQTDSKPETEETIKDTSDAVLADIQSPQELTAYVETVLLQLQTKFDDLSLHLFSKMDDMASRIDMLEKSLEELLQQSISEEIVTEESKS